MFRHLSESEIERLTYEIANMPHIDAELIEDVFQEFEHMAIAQEYINLGGLEYAREVLEKAIGSQKASEIIERLADTLQVRPFDFARKADAAQLLELHSK